MKGTRSFKGKTTYFFLSLYAYKDLLPMGICKTSFPPQSLTELLHIPSQVSVTILFLWAQQHTITLLNCMFLIAGLTTLKFNFDIFTFAPLIILLLLFLIVLPDPLHLRPPKSGSFPLFQNISFKESFLLIPLSLKAELAPQSAILGCISVEYLL